MHCKTYFERSPRPISEEVTNETKQNDSTTSIKKGLQSVTDMPAPELNQINLKIMSSSKEN